MLAHCFRDLKFEVICVCTRQLALSSTVQELRSVALLAWCIIAWCVATCETSWLCKHKRAVFSFWGPGSGSLTCLQAHTCLGPFISIPYIATHIFGSLKYNKHKNTFICMTLRSNKMRAHVHNTMCLPFHCQSAVPPTIAVPNTTAVVRGLRNFIYIHFFLLQLIIQSIKVWAGMHHMTCHLFCHQPLGCIAINIWHSAFCNGYSPKNNSIVPSW